MRRPARPRPKTSARAAFLRVEAMESRLLLNADPLSPIAAGAFAVPGAIGIPIAASSIAPVMVGPFATGPLATGPAVSGPYSPAQIRHAYGIDQQSYDGTGQTIAIIDAYDDPTIAADLNAFDATFFGAATAPASSFFTKVTPPTQQTPVANSTWELEIALDVEWAHAIAPKAKIVLVEAQSSGLNDLLGAVDYAVSQGANQVSMSWGAGDFGGSSFYDTHFNHPGVTFLASSGDGGAGVEFPAVSQYVTGVGGTSISLDATGNMISETTWSGSGGGISNYISKPSYQAGFLTGTKRGVPDVAYDADPNSGVLVDNGGNWLGVGGTSAGAPQWAGLMALVNQGRAGYGKSPIGTGQTLGTNSVLYQLAGGTTYTNPNGDFRDVTTGSNGNPVTAGYDTATGLGSPVANKLIPDLVGPPPAPVAVVINDGGVGYSETPGPWAHWTGQGYGGDVEEAQAGDGTALADWNFTGLAPGNYQVSVTYSTYANRATNAPYTVYDGATPLGTVAVNQQAAPSGVVDGSGNAWLPLGIVTITGSALRVELSNLANGRVEADAVRIVATAAPATFSPVAPAPVAVVINDGGAGYSETPGPWAHWTGQGYGGDVEEAFPGDGTALADWNFTGLAPGNYQVSVTYSTYANRATNAPYTVYDGATPLGTVAVNQQAAPSGVVDGSGNAWLPLGVVAITGSALRVELSNLANGRVEADAVRIVATAAPATLLPVAPAPVAVVINNDTPGYSQTPGSWAYWTGQGYGGDVEEALAGDDTALADWNFTGLAPGNYQVSVTYSTYANRATNAPYTVYDGATPLGTVAVNQQAAPSGVVDGSGNAWLPLGTFTITGSALRVELSNLANGRVEADAVRIIAVSGTSASTAVASPASVTSVSIPGLASVSTGSGIPGVVKIDTSSSTSRPQTPKPLVPAPPLGPGLFIRSAKGRAIVIGGTSASLAETDD